MLVEAVVFDLGGTLVEYTGRYASWPELEIPGFNAAYNSLSKQGVRMPELGQFRTVGLELLPGRWQKATSGIENLTVPSLLLDVLSRFGSQLPSSAMLDEAAVDYQAAICAGAKPIPHGLEVVKWLKANHYKLALVSNTMFAARAHVADLENFGLASYFDSMLFSADANKWKPNADPFLEVLEQIEVQPQASVFVGDDPSADVVGGRRAGMYTVHYHSSQRFASPDGITPDATIHSLLELPPVLPRLGGE